VSSPEPATLVVDDSGVTVPGCAGTCRRTGVGVMVGFGLSLIGLGDGVAIGTGLP
jgi:hypothetical protein